MKTLPERIDEVRRYGILVSDDGFFGTPTGPVHVDDSELCRALLAHDDLLAACQNLTDRLDELAAAMRRRELGNWVNEWLGDGIVEAARAAISKAEGGEA